jgi:hypothetical protein
MLPFLLGAAIACWLLWLFEGRFSPWPGFLLMAAIGSCLGWL